MLIVFFLLFHTPVWCPTPNRCHCCTWGYLFIGGSLEDANHSLDFQARLARVYLLSQNFLHDVSAGVQYTSVRTQLWHSIGSLGKILGGGQRIVHGVWGAHSSSISMSPF